MKTLNKKIFRLLILISLIVVIGVSFIVTSAIYKGAHSGFGSLVLDKGINIEISDADIDSLSRNMSIPVQYYTDKSATIETNRKDFSVEPTSSTEYYIANPTITAQEGTEPFYLRVKLNALYYVDGSATPTAFSMSLAEKQILYGLFSTDSNYSPIKFNDYFAADANGEYYYYVSGGYGVATKNNLQLVNAGDEIKLLQGFLANDVTPVSSVYFKYFESIPNNVAKITFTLDIELATAQIWDMPDVKLLTEDEITLSEDKTEIIAINALDTTYALPGYATDGTKITSIGVSKNMLDGDAVKVYFANTMTTVGGYNSVSSLNKIYLGNNVTTIAPNAFSYSGLTGDLILPITVTNIGEIAFSDCGFSCEFPYIPNIATIGNYAFNSCDGLIGTLHISGSVGNNAFENTGFDVIKIASGATSLGQDSLSNLTSLLRVYVDSSSISSLDSSNCELLSNSNLTDIFVKEGLTVGEYISNNANFVLTKSNVSGYNHYGRAVEITWNGGSNEGTLDANLWNYAGSTGYTSTNAGSNSVYTFSDKNAMSKVGINGENIYYLPTPIISGYTFNGWFTTADDTGVKVATADGWIASVSGYTDENKAWIKTDATTLYAHYTKKSFTISYNLAGGGTSSTRPTKYTFGTTTSIPNPTRYGYTFLGWTVSSSLTGKTYGTINLDDGHQQFDSNYTSAVYYELYYLNNNVTYTGALSSSEVRWRMYTTAGAYNGSSSSTSVMLSSDGYASLWYHLGKSSSNTTISFTTGTSYSVDAHQVGDLTLTARWQANTHTVTLDADGGSVDPSSIQVTYNSAYGTLPTPVKENYTFECWKYGDEVITSSTILTSAYNHTLTAYYVPNFGYLRIDWQDVVAPYVGNDLSNVERIYILDSSSFTPNSTDVMVYVGASTSDGRTPSTDVAAYIRVRSNSTYTIYFVRNGEIYAPVDSTGLFKNLKGLKYFSGENLQMIYSQVISQFFYGCSSLNNIYLGEFNVHNVVDASGLFYGCSSLTDSSVQTLNQEPIDFYKVTNISHMFEKCSSLTTISFDGSGNFPALKFQTLMNTSYMFKDCTSLTSIQNLKDISTYEVTDMSYMFAGCTALTNFVLEADTSSVQTAIGMFKDCTSLRNLYLTDCAFKKLINANNMLSGLTALMYLYTPEGTNINIDLPSGYLWYEETDTSYSAPYSQIIDEKNTGGKCLVPKEIISYLYKYWADETIGRDTVGNLTFTNVEPTSYEDVYSVGASDINGDSPWSGETSYVLNATAYVTKDQNKGLYDVVIYSPATIYAPEDSGGLFYMFRNLQTITFNNFNTSLTTVMSEMFLYCDSLTSLDLTSFDTTNVEKMEMMFICDTDNLKEIDLSSFDMTNVIGASDMLSSTIGLITIKTPKALNNSVQIDLNSAFVDVATGNSYSQITSSMLTNGSITLQKVAYLTQGDVWQQALSGYTITSIEFSHTIPSSYSKYVDIGATNYTGSTISTTGNIRAYLSSEDGKYYNAVFYSPYNIFAPQNSSGLFANLYESTGYTTKYADLTELTTINFNNCLDTSVATDMSKMFSYCSNLTNLDVSCFNTSNVKDMSGMFIECYGLTSLDLTSFNTSKVENMSWMFSACSELNNINLSSFDTSNVTDMSGMFSSKALTSLDLSNFNTSKVKNMSKMFAYSRALTSLDLSNFDTNNVLYFDGMFMDCEALKTLDISSFVVSLGADVSSMFDSCLVLEKIKTPASVDSSISIYLPNITGYAYFSFADTTHSTPHLVINSSNVNDTLVLVSTSNIYTVTFDANGGSTSTTSKTVTYGSTYGTLPTPTRTGYSFAGWYTAQTGGTKIISTSQVTNAYDHTLYAQWAGNSYTVTFNANGGTVSPNTKSVTYGSTYDTLPTPTAPTETGYSFTFKGWYTAASGGTKITSTTSVSTLGNHTLYAQWTQTANKYTVSFNANGGSVDTASKNVTYNSTYGTLPTPTRTGYTFNGWFTAASGGTKIVDTTKVTTANNHTLYAQWTANTYTVTFNANGGSVSTTSKSVTYGSTYGTLPTPTKTVTGYTATFKGWYTASSGGTKVTADTVVSTAGNHTLYAQWEQTANTYTVLFNANGGTVSQTSKSVTFGSTYGTLPTPTAPIETGYSFTFNGWFTAASGGTKITETTKVTTASGHTLYAQWTKTANQYTVEFNPNQKGGLMTDVADGTYTGNNATITYTSANHQYKFVNSSSSDPYATIEATVYLVANTTYTMHAKLYDANGVALNSGSIQIFYAINGAYSESNSKRISASGGSVTFTVSTTGTYKIRLDNDCGQTILIKEFYITNEFTTSKNVAYDSAYGTLPTPTRENYTFEGWFTAASGGTQITSDTIVKITSTQTLYAHWTLNNSYLLTGSKWQQALIDANSNYTQANIANITFTNTKPTSGTVVSVGATSADGTTAYVAGTRYITDVKAYVTSSSTSGKYDVTFYSPLTIYAPQDSSYLFSSPSNSKLTSLTSIKFDNFSTINATTMRSMFMDCSALTSINLTNFNTSNVTLMWSMFEGCSKLSSLDLRSFNTSKVTDMDSMFKNCSNLSSVYTSSFITTNVKYMTDMFASTNLSSLDISNFDMSNTTYVSGMLSFSTSQFDFYELITPKAMKTAITLPFHFCKASDYSGDYASIPTSLTSTKLLTKYVQVYRYDEGTWEKCSLSTSISGFNNGDTVTVARGTYIDIYLEAKGYALERSWVRAVFYGLLSKPSLVSGPSGTYASWRFKDGDNNNVNSLLANEDLSLGIIDERTNVEEIELGDNLVLDINKDNEITPTWATATGRYYCLLECQQTVAMKCNATIRIRAESNFTSIYGLGGKGSPLRLPW